MASDDEAYKTFGDLFAPIIKDLHPQYDFRYSYQFQELNGEEIADKIRKMEKSIKTIDNYRIEIKRNFKGTPFTPLMTKEAKLQVERRVVEVLGDLYGNYKQVKNIDEKDKKWLAEVGVDLTNRSKELDAAGINDDWPVGRGVFIQDEKDFLVLVNFEDHLQFIVLPNVKNSSDGLNQGIQRAIKLIQAFEKLVFAVDPYLGNLTVSP
jgi:protein-arginine kinase